METDFEVEIEPRPLCSLCGRTERAHQHTAHRFMPPGQAARLVQNDAPEQSPPDNVPVAQGPVRIASGSSSDALLRMLLIRKGILTVQELDDLETELKTIGMVTHDPVDQP